MVFISRRNRQYFSDRGPWAWQERGNVLGTAIGISRTKITVLDVRLAQYKACELVRERKNAVACQTKPLATGMERMFSQIARLLWFPDMSFKAFISEFYAHSDVKNRLKENTVLLSKQTESISYAQRYLYFETENHRFKGRRLFGRMKNACLSIAFGRKALFTGRRLSSKINRISCPPFNHAVRCHESGSNPHSGGQRNRDGGTQEMPVTFW